MFIFDDRVEIINPGTFPPGITPENPEHKPVNPIICDLMYDIKFAEEMGSGIYRMKQSCKEWGNEEPIYNLGSTRTTLIFKSPVAIDELIKGLSLRNKKKQLKALEYIRENGKITNSEYRKLTGTTKRTASRHLKELVEKGVLKQKGQGRWTSYIL